MNKFQSDLLNGSLPTSSPGGVQTSAGFVSGKNYQHGYVPNSSSDDDITQGLLANYQYQAGLTANTDNTATAQANYLNWLLTQNQRQYDENWRDNEREYTSASAQLQRLMATGMSYSAALAALNGSGESGSSSGISQMTADKADPSADIQNSLGIANSVMNGVTSLGNAVFGGLTAVSTMNLNTAQAALLSTQAGSQQINTDILRRDYEGKLTADSVNGAIRTSMANGSFVPTTESLTSAESLVNAAYNAKVIPHDLLKAYYSNTAAQSAFTSMYSDNYASAGAKPTSKDYEEQRKAIVNGWLAQQFEPTIKKAELDLLNQDILKRIAEVKLTNKDVTLKDAQIGLTKAQTTAQQYENHITYPKAMAYMEHAKEMKPYYWWQFNTDLAQAAAFGKDPKRLERYWSQVLDNMENNADYEGQLIGFHIAAANAFKIQFPENLSRSTYAAMHFYNMNMAPLSEKYFVKKYSHHTIKDAQNMIESFENTETIEESWKNLMNPALPGSVLDY